MPRQDLLLWRLLDRVGVLLRLGCRIRLQASQVVVGFEGVSERPAVSAMRWRDPDCVVTALQGMEQVLEDAWDTEVEYCGVAEGGLLWRAPA